MKTLSSIVLATLLTGSLAGPADAAVTAGEIRQREVSFADLNLNNAAGAQVLYRRIRAAAREVCGRPEGVLAILEATDRRQCVAAVTARAVEDVNAPALTRYYIEHRDSAYDLNAQSTAALLSSDGAGEIHRK